MWLKDIPSEQPESVDIGLSYPFLGFANGSLDFLTYSVVGGGGGGFLLLF